MADVAADNVGQAYLKAHSEGNVLDPHDTSWKDWQKNAGVRVLVSDTRGADFGDVIVSPDDQPHQLINGGFRNIPWMPLREVAPEVGRAHAAVAPEGGEEPSPARVAADITPSSAELSTGRTKGKKP